MKFKKIMFVSILLLAILAIGAVSAADENITSETLAAEEKVIDAPVSVEDTLIASDVSEITSEGDVLSATDNVTDDVVGMETADKAVSQQINESKFQDEDSIVLKSDNSGEILSISNDDVLDALEIDFGEKIVMLDSFPSVSITFPKDVKIYSEYKFYIDGKIYSKDTIDYRNEYIDIDLDKISCGKHSYKLTYKNGKNKLVTKTGTFTADWGRDFDIMWKNMDEIFQGESYTANVWLPDDANGKLKVIVNNEKTYYFGRNVVISDLPLGYNELVFKYSDSKYSIEKTFTYYTTVFEKINGPNSVSYMENATFSLTLPSDAKGQLTANVDKKDNYIASFVNGTAKITLPILAIGTHMVHLQYTGNDYPVKSIDSSLVVGAKLIFPTIMEYGKNEYFIAELPNDANGTLTIKIDDEIQNAEFKNGTTNISLSKLTYGPHEISVSYKNDGKYSDLDYEEYYEWIVGVINDKNDNKYFNFDQTANVFVKCDVKKFNVSFSNEIYPNLATKLTFNGPSDYTGEVTVLLNGKTTTGKFSNGKAVVSITPKSSGLKTVYYKFDFTYTDQEWETANITVLLKPAFKFMNYYKMYDSKPLKFKARIYDGYGKPVGAGEKVKVTSYKYSKTLKTDKNGYIHITINRLGEFTYCFAYKGFKYYRDIELEDNALFFCHADNPDIYVGYGHTFNIKKSSKKYTFNVGMVAGWNTKKLYAYQKFTVKLNGKSYHGKTNSQGYGKVTIPQKDIKKLKVGKKYQLTLAYGIQRAYKTYARVIN